MPMSFEEQLRSALDRLGDYGPAGPVPDLTGQARQRTRRHRLAGSVAVVAAAALVATGVWALQRHPHSQTVVAAGSGQVSALPAAPIAGRSDMASVWTGQQWLIWGGSDGRRWFADGAAFDPAANRWTKLPSAPLEARIDPASVWTGRLWLIWGGTSAKASFRDGAAYDPTTRTWRLLPAPPATLPADGNFMPEGVWDGSELIIVTSTGHAAAYQPGAHRWVPVAAPPGVAAVPHPQAVWTGSSAVFLLGTQSGSGAGLSSPTTQPPTSAPGASTGSSPPGTPPPPSTETPGGEYHLAAYDPRTGTWSELPAGGLQPGSEPDLVWTGRLLLTLDPVPAQRGQASNYPNSGYHPVTTPAGINAAYDPTTHSWTVLPAIPNSFKDPGPFFTLGSDPAAWTGTAVLLWAGGDHGLSYTPDTRTWAEFPSGGGPARQRQATAWTGTDLLGWGGSSAANALHMLNTGIRYEPSS